MTDEEKERYETDAGFRKRYDAFHYPWKNKSGLMITDAQQNQESRFILSGLAIVKPFSKEVIYIPTFTQNFYYHVQEKRIQGSDHD